MTVLLVLQPGVVGQMMAAAEERPWLWVVYILTVALPVFLVVLFCCSGKVNAFPLIISLMFKRMFSKMCLNVTNNCLGLSLPFRNSQVLQNTRRLMLLSLMWWMMRKKKKKIKGKKKRRRKRRTQMRKSLVGKLGNLE